jgi:hypothetical protein
MKLAEESFLTDDFLRQLINVGEVDIIVGLPTHNNAKTVGPIVHTIQSGILRGFPRERAVIINADGGSRDGTPKLVTGVSIDDVRPASNLRAMMSPESVSIEPEWLSKLLRPIYNDGFDLVTPTYRRHKFEGLLITNFLYPMTRALYGLRIREAYAPEFGFSGRFGSHFLEQNVWNDGTEGSGVELRFTLAAITGRYLIGQSFLGEKDHIERSAAELVPVLRQTVGALFSALEADFPVWSAVAGSQLPPTTGADHEMLLDPLRVNRKRLREMFATGVAELESVFQSILSPSTLAELQRIARLGDEEFHYPAELWVRTVYEFAASYRKSVISRDHIIQALAPLFRGRVFTFLMENRNASADEVENNIEGLCLEFERLKPYLLQLWK